MFSIWSLRAWDVTRSILSPCLQELCYHASYDVVLQDNTDGGVCRLMDVSLSYLVPPNSMSDTARSRIFQCSQHTKSSMIRVACDCVAVTTAAQFLEEAWSRLDLGLNMHLRCCWMWRWKASDLKFLRLAMLPLRPTWFCLLQEIVVPSNQIIVVCIIIQTKYSCQGISEQWRASNNNNLHHTIL